MQKSIKLDHSKLLGFDTVSHELADGVDFQNENVGAKIGAKVGDKGPGGGTAQPSAIELPVEIGDAGAPIMQGLGGRKVAG